MNDWSYKSDKYSDQCWRCGTLFAEKSSWKKWPQGPTCLLCRKSLEEEKQEIAGDYWDEKDKSAWYKKVTAWEQSLTPAKKPENQGMKKGDIRRIPASSSPVWTDQWAAQGTGKIPYIVSHKKNAAGTSLEWQCSCPAWCTTTPREDCKHILKVKLVENIPLSTKTNGSVHIGHVSLGQLTIAPPSPTTLPKVKTGRKFR